MKRRVEFIESYIKGDGYEDSGEYKWNDNHGELIRCRNCCHWKPPHIRLNDGRQRLYREGEKDNDPFKIGVTIDVGMNIGGKCWLEHNRGYARDMRVFRNEDDFCSRARKLPDGTTAEVFWGLSTEPAELLDD